MDPLLSFLEKRLQGIVIHSLPVSGPSLRGQPRKLPPLESRYKLTGYCDDLKPSITSMEEYTTIHNAVVMYESASGCVLHRDISSKKCKILLMGEWKKWSQDEIPLNFLTKSDFLDMLGVKIYSNYTETRRKNGEMLVKGVKETIDRWKSGKFMAFTDRTSCVNTYVLSKIWYKTSAIDFNKGDFEKITSYIKSWLYQDSLLKPDEILLYRKITDGGLGLFHIESKSKAKKLLHLGKFLHISEQSI